MIQDWQLTVLNKIQGIKKGPLSLTMGSRQTGKSSSAAYMRMWNDLYPNPVERLVLSEGTVYGSPYYCVEPIGGSWLEMEKWCIQSCGESTGSIWAEEKYKHSAQPGERWYGNNRKFWFRDEQDRMMFVLKWR